MIIMKIDSIYLYSEKCCCILLDLNVLNILKRNRILFISLRNLIDVQLCYNCTMISLHIKYLFYHMASLKKKKLINVHITVNPPTEVFNQN